MKTLVVIPARGGSKGIPGKNVRHLAGKPLISYPIRAALKSKFVDDVIVTTDSDKIEHISNIYGSEVIKRPAYLANDDVPLDPVVNHCVEEVEKVKAKKYDIVITIQATSPLLKTSTINSAIEQFIKNNKDSMISVVDDRHLTWTKKNNQYVPNYQKRVNRQYLPPNYKETGGIFITKREFVSENSRFGKVIDLFEVPYYESIDIDTESDWWISEKILNRRKILFRVDGDRLIGMGHIYRTLLLAYRLIDHEIVFVTNASMEIGLNKLIESNFRVEKFHSEDSMWNIITREKADIVINDILDTDIEYMTRLQEMGSFVANFEDLGKGASVANVVINALYDEKYRLDNHYWGKDFYCLKDEFHITKPIKINEVVNNILITFGGTDPNNYTLKVLKVLKNVKKNLNIEVILGLGYADIESLKKEISALELDVVIHRNVTNISKHMSEADLIFTSAGRTIYEIASLGVPNIVLAQNMRELHHTFASPDNGIVNLKLGYEVSDEELLTTIIEMMENFSIRKNNHVRMLSSNLKKGVDTVLETILNNYTQWEESNE